jgi:5-methylcytosine-specific restriction enzyme A
LNLVVAYRTLTFRGALDPSFEGEDVGDGLKSHVSTLIEMRRYRLHRRIERNSSASKLAKGTHGVRCQCCGFDFVAVYGEIGSGFIEVHHLRPLADLEEGKAIRYDVAADFAVLCANCHRMIHRQRDPADLADLRARLQM